VLKWLRGWEFDEMERKSTATKKPNSYPSKERERFFNLLRLCQESGSSMISLKRFLFKLADKYKQEYLINYYYFI
jgi:hypothetical protein